MTNSRSMDSQSLRALREIRELVYGGGVSPGERMSELALVARLGLSRTPVRAALARLEMEGLLERIPSGGYAVRAFSRADVRDAIELRGVLEGTAARFAAERSVSPERLAKVKALLQEIDTGLRHEDGLSLNAYTELNERFHQFLVDLSGSEVVRRQIERICALPFASPNSFVQVQAALPEFQAVIRQAQVQHWSIVEAIELREGSRAEALAREHSRLALRNLEDYMSSERLRKKMPALATIMTMPDAV